MDVQQALDAARFNRVSDRSVSFEAPVGAPVIATLRAMGHEQLDSSAMMGGLQVFFGGGQAIMRRDRGYVAGSDPRRDGLAAAH